MQTQVGERYRCSDPECGCEIEVKTVGNTGQDSFLSDSSGSATDRNIGGSATGETGSGTLRNAESGSIATPGDFGSQGATGEGVFGTSGGNQRSTMSGRLGSTTGALKSGRTGSPAATTGSNRDLSADDDARFAATSDDDGLLVSEEEESFSCCCGQPMVRTSSMSKGLSRSAGV